MSRLSSRSRRISERSGGGAIVLIALGVFFLLQQMRIIPDNLNWWAIFILLPGLLWLYQAITQPSETRASQTGKIVLSALIVLVGCVFLFDIQVDILPTLPWATIWPLLLIIEGVILLLRNGKNQST